MNNLKHAKESKAKYIYDPCTSHLNLTIVTIIIIMWRLIRPSVEFLKYIISQRLVVSKTHQQKSSKGFLHCDLSNEPLLIQFMKIFLMTNHEKNPKAELLFPIMPLGILT